MASRFFSKVQYGKETTRGTAVAATRMWTGKALNIPSDTKADYTAEDFGLRVESRRASVQQRIYENKLLSEHGIFQQLPILFGGGLKGGVVASEVTPSQADYKWTFTPSLTAANAPDAFTIEMGNDQQEYESEYCMFTRINISGEIGQGIDPSPVKIEADFFGRQLTASTFTAALSPPAPTGMNAKLARLYIDPTWAAVGSTELANLLRSFEIEILTGVHPNFSGSGNDYFNIHSEGLIAVMATFTIETNASAIAIMAAQRAQSLAVARLDVVGPVIGSGTAHRLRLDIGGRYEEVTLNDTEDRGDDLSTFALHGLYDDTGAKLLQCEVTTTLNAY
jgi:hypothetical protein